MDILTQNIDVAIIGGGPAGLAAAQYAARGGLNATVFEHMGVGGQVLLIDQLENYPGLPPTNGYDFSLQMSAQAKKFGAKIVIAGITRFEKEGDYFLISTKKENYRAIAVIVATGAKPKVMGIPGETEYLGAGVSYCATCDGPFFKGKRVAVIGGGDSACDESSFLTRQNVNVLLVHRRDAFRAQKSIVNQLLKNPKVEMRLNTQALEILGNGSVVTGIKLQDNLSGRIYDERVDGAFILVGHNPATDMFPQLPLTADGYIVTDQNLATSVRGIFAAGDVRDKLFRQVSTACADGALAAHTVVQYIESLSL